MDEVTIKTQELLAVLEENRAKHTQLYKDAVDGYKVAATKKLQNAIGKVGSGDLLSSVRLNIPQDHTEQYDEVIQMLKMSVDDETTLRRHEFQNYVQDKWVSVEEKNILRTFALSSANAGNYR